MLLLNGWREKALIKHLEIKRSRKSCKLWDCMCLCALSEHAHKILHFASLTYYYLLCANMGFLVLDSHVELCTIFFSKILNQICSKRIAEEFLTYIHSGYNFICNTGHFHAKIKRTFINFVSLENFYFRLATDRNREYGIISNIQLSKK